MGLLDKAKAAAEQAASKAKEGAQDLQAKRELSSAYGELGRLTVELVDAGEVTNPRLEEHVAKIRALRAEAENGAPPSSGAGTTPPASDQPPAMPV